MNERDAKELTKTLETPIDDKLEGWALVTCPNARWFGKVTRYSCKDGDVSRTLDLQPALQLAAEAVVSSLSVVIPSGEVYSGETPGLKMWLPFGQLSNHPVEDLHPFGGVEWFSKMSEDLRLYLLSAMADCVLGQLDHKTNTRRRRHG